MPLPRPLKHVYLRSSAAKKGQGAEVSGSSFTKQEVLPAPEAGPSYYSGGAILRLEAESASAKVFWRLRSMKSTLELKEANGPPQVDSSKTAR